MLNASRVKQIAYKVVPLVLALVVSLGAFFAPSKAYAFSAGAIGSINHSIVYDYDLEDLYVGTFYYNGSSYVPADFYMNDYNMNYDAIYFVAFVPIPIDLKQGDYVGFSGSFMHSTGTIDGLGFGVTSSMYISDSISNTSLITPFLTRTDFTISAYGTSFYSSILEVSQDCNTAYLIMYFNVDKNSTDWYLRYNSLKVTIEREGEYAPDFEDIKDKQDEQTGFLDGILTSIRNLAGSIVGGLSGFLNDIRTGVNNIASGVVDGLSDFFELLLGTDVFDGSFFEQFESGAGASIEDINDALASAPDVLRPSVEDLPNIERYAPGSDNYFIYILQRILNRIDFTYISLLCSLSFGGIGYVLFGKR